MSGLTREDILPIADFQTVRDAHEQEVLAAKQLRRLAVGPVMTLLFENRATMRWQIHEMCRVEGIVRPDAVQHELDTYNALLPTADSLSATLLIGIPDAAERDRELPRLIGLHEHVRIEFEGCAPTAATFDPDQFTAERISAVQFIRFPLTDGQRRALGDLSRTARVVIDHPRYTHSVALPGPTRAALIDDLREA